MRDFSDRYEERVMPAYSALSWPAGGRDWLTVGDAAASFDPLSSQGLLFSLQSGARGALAAKAALDGNCDAIAEYSAIVGAVFSKYLEERTDQYAAERRWETSSFWARRLVSSGIAGAPVA